MLRSKHFRSPKINFVKKIWGPKKFWVQKIFGSKMFWGPVGSKKLFCPKHCGFQKNLVQKMYVKKKFKFYHLFCPRGLGPKKIFFVRKNFWSRNLCRTKCWSEKFKAPKRLGPKSLVKIGSVIAEIFLPWTNVAWTYVSRTVGIY